MSGLGLHNGRTKAAQNLHKGCTHSAHTRSLYYVGGTVVQGGTVPEPLCKRWREEVA